MKHIQLTEPQRAEYSAALSDIICWMSGFKAAGGIYSPGSIGELMELNIKLKDAMEEEE